MEIVYHPRMRNCPSCKNPFEVRHVQGVEVDFCKKCGGLFLDAGEAEAQGIETHALFGVGAEAAKVVGGSDRKCPAHEGVMMTVEVTKQNGQAVQIERATCCGGLFLDPGEQTGLADAARRAVKLASAAEGSGFALPPWLQGGAGKAPPAASVLTGLVGGGAMDEMPDDGVTRCPRCRGEMEVDKRDGVELDTCIGCGSLFMDAGESKAFSVQIEALFGAEEGSAVDHGPSALPCPKCRKAMTTLSITSVFGVLEIEKAECCGGVFLDGGEEDAFIRAARRAETYAADAQFVKDGEVVGETAVQAHLQRSGALAEGQKRMSEALAELQKRKEEERRRRGRRRRRAFGDDDYY